MTSERRGNATKLVAGGDWLIRDVPTLNEQTQGLAFDAPEIEIDATRISALDSAGALLLLRVKKRATDDGRKLSGFAYPEQYKKLFEMLERNTTEPSPAPPHQPRWRALVERVGKSTVELGKLAYEMVGFLGRITAETFQAVIRPARELPWPSFINQIEEIGINALPIVGLLSFLLGVVLAYQGADQLKRFGAEMLTINLVGISILREVGVLMTAIIVAGRSGSAFTAHIGTMKVNQEIDAMRTMGLNTAEVLVLPRFLGLLVALPLLTFYADVMGILGGAAMCYFDLGITIPAFVRQLHDAIELNTLLVGLIKAPVFAAIIAIVGCFEGFRVEDNAASVGKHTTKSVVESIFLVIVVDAAFSILFSIIGI